MHFHNTSKPFSLPEFGLPTRFIRGYNSGIYANTGEMNPNKLGGGQHQPNTKTEDSFKPETKTTLNNSGKSMVPTGSDHPIATTTTAKKTWLRNEEEDFIDNHDYLLEGAHSLFDIKKSPIEKLPLLGAALFTISSLVLGLYITVIAGEKSHMNFLQDGWTLEVILALYFGPLMGVFMSVIAASAAHHNRNEATKQAIYKKGLIPTLAKLDRYSELLKFLKTSVSVRLEKNIARIAQMKSGQESRLDRAEPNSQKQQKLKKSLNTLQEKEKEYLTLQADLNDVTIALEFALEHGTEIQSNDLSTILTDFQNRLSAEQEVS